MKFCESCGAKLPENAVFCEECGTPVAEAGAAADMPEESPATKGTASGFCENCGAPIHGTSRFCEECGAPLPESADAGSSMAAGSAAAGDTKKLASAFNAGTKAGWEDAWRNIARSAGDDLGLILTNMEQLASDFNTSIDEVRSTLIDIMESRRNDGVTYALIDINNNAIDSSDGSDVERNVGLLSTIVNVARPRYLMIIGNENAINVATWDNQSYDGDEQVLADLPYATLDCTSPWEGQKFNLGDAMRVGRIPTYSGESISELRDYFIRVEKYSGKINTIVPFGLSALVWKDESNALYKGISSDRCKTSPNVKNEGVLGEIPAGANLLYFNLHGSDQTKFWYGQEGGTYPTAFSPEAVASLNAPYFIGVEACYGARYTDGLTKSDSIVMSALSSGCLALMGSSMIAYGTSQEPGCCADVVIGRYIKDIAAGCTAGDAYINAIKELTSKSDLDDAEIKTLAEFSLYGDPSVSTKKRHTAGKLFKAFGGVKKGLHVPMPDIHRAVHAKLVQVDAKIAGNVQKSVYTKYAGFEGTEPKFFQMSNTGMLQAAFEKTDGMMKQVLKVYFDDKGKIKKEYHSK